MARYSPKQSVSLEDTDIQSPDIPENAEVPETPDEGEVEISKEFTEAETTVAATENAVNEMVDVTDRLSNIEEQEGYLSNEVAELGVVAVENIALKYNLNDIATSLESIRNDKYNTSDVSLEGIQSVIARTLNTVNGAVQTLIKAGIGAARSSVNGLGKLQSRVDSLSENIKDPSNRTVQGEFLGILKVSDIPGTMNYLTVCTKELLSTSSEEEFINFIKTFTKEFTNNSLIDDNGFKDHAGKLMFVWFMLSAIVSGLTFESIFSKVYPILFKSAMSMDVDAQIKIPNEVPNLFKALPAIAKNNLEKAGVFETKISDDLFLGKKIVTQQWVAGEKFGYKVAADKAAHDASYKGTTLLASLLFSSAKLAAGAVGGALAFSYVSKGVLKTNPGLYVVNEPKASAPDSVKALSSAEQRKVLGQAKEVLNLTQEYWSGWGNRANKYWSLVKQSNQQIVEHAQRVAEKKASIRIMMASYYRLPTYLRQSLWSGIIEPKSTLAKHNAKAIGYVLDYVEASQK